MGDCNGKLFLIDLINLLTQKELNDLFALYADPYILKNPGKYKRCTTPNCDNILFKKEKKVNIIDHIRKKRGGEAEFNSDDEKKLEENGEVIKNQIENPEDLLNNSSEDNGEEDDQGQVVFCECCGHDFCFACMKNHYGGDCVKEDIKRVASPYPANPAVRRPQR